MTSTEIRCLSYVDISIHTPTRGVTEMCLSICAGIIISIHTPTRGVTYNRYIEQEGAEDFNPHSHKGSDNSFHAEFSAKLHFNPHSHKGSDLLAHIGNIAGKKISIHTPTRGVTAYYCINHYTSVISIHTPTRGVTWEMKYLVIKSIFQSTLPQGE